MKFTGLVVSFLVAYAQAELPYNLRDTSGSNPRAVAEPRHFSKTYDGQRHGATGTGGYPHHRPRPTGKGRHHPSSSAPQGAYPTNFEGPLPGPPGQRGGVAKSDNGDGKAWGPNQGQFPPGAWPPAGKGNGHGHGTGLSLPPWPVPTGGYPHLPGSGQPPKWPKTTLSTHIMSLPHSQSGVAKPTGPVKPYEQDDE